MMAALALGDRQFAASELASLSASARYRDRAGHVRDVYDGLVRMSICRASRALALPMPSVTAEIVEPPFTGDNAQHVARSALIAAGQLDRAFLESVINHQHAGGSYLKLNPGDNPEPAWYHDLAILHAITNYALECEDDHATSSVRRAATYVTHEVQPDHASAQPWAVHAMLLCEDSLPLADILLHAAGVQSPATMDGVSILLLADAMWSLQSFDDKTI